MILVCTPEKVREQVIEALSTIHVYKNSKFFFTEVRAQCGTKNTVLPSLTVLC